MLPTLLPGKGLKSRRCGMRWVRSATRRWAACCRRRWSDSTRRRSGHGEVRRSGDADAAALSDAADRRGPRRAIEAEMNRGRPVSGHGEAATRGAAGADDDGGWSPAVGEEDGRRNPSRNHVTWNKQMPLEFHIEVRKTYSLLTSIAIFCGLGRWRRWCWVSLWVRQGCDPGAGG